MSKNKEEDDLLSGEEREFLQKFTEFRDAFYAMTLRAADSVDDAFAARKSRKNEVVQKLLEAFLIVAELRVMLNSFWTDSVKYLSPHPAVSPDNSEEAARYLRKCATELGKQISYGIPIEPQE